MEILGYIVQVFDEDKLLPETGYKHLHKVYQQALDSAKMHTQDYMNQFPNGLVGPFEFHTPTKKQTDENGYSIIFRDAEIQIWIEVIIA